MSDLKFQDRVQHWFAGTGTVLKSKGRAVTVKWDSGKRGIAYREDLKPAPERAQRQTETESGDE
jgi:hypothetical protein